MVTTNTQEQTIRGRFITGFRELVKLTEDNNLYLETV